MFSALAQRAALRLPSVSGSLLLRPRAAPVVLRPVATRAFSSSPLVAFPKAATKTVTSEEHTTETKVEKKATKKPASKARTAAKKKPAKKAVKAAKPRKVKKDTKVAIGKEHAKPKSARTSFVIFFGEFWRSQDRTGVTLQDSPKILAAASERWRAMSEAEKERYRDLAKVEQEAAKERIKEWRLSLPHEVQKEINKRRTAAGKYKIAFRRAYNREDYILPAYARFVKAFATTFNPAEGQSGKDMLKAAADKWRELPEHEKQVYHDAYSRAKAEKQQSAAPEA